MKNRTFRQEFKHLRSRLRAVGRDPYAPALRMETAVERYRRKRMPRMSVQAIINAAWASSLQTHLDQTDVLWAQRQMLKELR